MADELTLKHISPLDATLVGIALARVILASKGAATTDAQAEAVVDEFFATVDEVVGKYKNA